MHRWGISLPGACEGLCHWHGTIQPLVANGTLEPLVAADLDLVNMSGNAEWLCIREALRTHFPEAAAWTGWQHQADSVAFTTRATFATNQGAEQGDVLGTVQSALVLEQAREAHLGTEDKGVCDEWFVDDGSLSTCPGRSPCHLRRHRVRCAWQRYKSSARLLCPPERQHEFQGWDTPYVHDTVDVLVPEAGTTALLSAFGSREHVNARAWESARACDEMRCDWQR